MPRGFLVKRYSSPCANGTFGCSNQVDCDIKNNCEAPLALIKARPISRYSDEDRSDSSCSEQEVPSVAPITSMGCSKQIKHLPQMVYTIPNVLVNNVKQESNEVPLALTKPSTSPSSGSSHLVSEIRNNYLGPHEYPFATPSPDRRVRPSKTLSIPNCPSSPTKNSITISKKRVSDSSHKSFKRHKVIHKLSFDELKTSPVSGTLIRDSDSEEDFVSSNCIRRAGDIDPSLNVVVITEEAKAELEKIENKIGAYICQLCKDTFDDAFGLASHRCPRIVYIEYRCPECEKVFNCPANLASHRRWHKPRNGSNPIKSEAKNVKVLVAGTVKIDKP